MYESPFEIAKMVVNLQILNTLRNDEASLVGEFKFVFMTAFISDRKLVFMSEFILVTVCFHLFMSVFQIEFDRFEIYQPNILACMVLKVKAEFFSYRMG